MIGARPLWMLIVFSMLPESAGATIFWTEDFENHLTPNWDTAACNGGAVYPGPQDGCNPRISTAAAHTGTHSLLADYTCQGAPSTQCGTFMDRLHPASSELYTRFFYMTQNFVYSPVETKDWFHKPSHSGLANGDFLLDHGNGGPLPGGQFEWASENQNNDGPPCKPGDVSCNYVPNTATVNIVDDQWYCVETHWRSNSTPTTADGILELWVNGTQTVRYTNRLFGTDALTPWHFDLLSPLREKF